MRIAVVGAGIAGLSAAWLLQHQGHFVTLFEANDYLGGHTHTVDVTLDGRTAPVDTGFMVYNERTYPHLVTMFAALGVESVASDMSFSVRVDQADIEWAGTSIATLFAQPRNLGRGAFWRMLADIARFNRQTTAMLRADDLSPVSLQEFLDEGAYSEPFRDWYLLPMAGAIWSSPRKAILDFPLPAFVRFCANHGLLQMADRPSWRTVAGGARTYVDKMAASLRDIRLATPVTGVRRTPIGAEIAAGGATERFDEVVLACHSDQALRILGDASDAERALLGAVHYQQNRAVLHTDTALLPRRRQAWSSWNYLAMDDHRGDSPVAVSYLMNRLQPLPFARPVMITLNPPFEPDPASVIDEFDYAHPLLDGNAVAAQSGFDLLQGARHTWYAGAWLGYGFHEDGLKSAHGVAAGIATAMKNGARGIPERAAA